MGQTTLRDALTDAFDNQVPDEAGDTTQPVVADKAVTASETEQTPEQTRTERSRDQHGKFAKGETEPAKAPLPVSDKSQTEVTQIKSRPQRPSSWKKEMWDHWEKLDPSVAEYLSQREQEYAKGVSTYKNEWENAKPLMEAMNQFAPILQQHNIKPSEWITNLGNAHKTLALGSPEQRLQMFAKLAQQYQVPLQALLLQDQGQPDQMQYINPLYERINQLEGRLHSWQSEREQQEQSLIQREISQFGEKHEHFEAVRETMAGLLQSGLADSLDDAYQAAIRHPRHADIFEAQQQRQRQQDEARKAKEAKERVLKARANTVSPKTSTPAGQAQAGGKKGLRDQLSEAFDTVTDSRV